MSQAMPQGYETLLLERRGRVALITINRPEKRNALNIKTREEGAALLADLDRDDSVGVVVITGAGDKAFIAGADIASGNWRINAHDAPFGGATGNFHGERRPARGHIHEHVTGFAAGKCTIFADQHRTYILREADDGDRRRPKSWRGRCHPCRRTHDQRGRSR